MGAFCDTHVKLRTDEELRVYAYEQMTREKCSAQEKNLRRVLKEADSRNRDMLLKLRLDIHAFLKKNY